MTSTEAPLIMVAEDEFLICLEMEHMLKELGCAILGPAARLEEAFELLERAEPQAALLDVNLKGQDVFPLADALRERAVPIAFTTGYDQHDRLPERFHGCRVIAKPFSMEDIAAALQDLLER